MVTEKGTDITLGGVPVEPCHVSGWDVHPEFTVVTSACVARRACLPRRPPSAVTAPPLPGRHVRLRPPDSPQPFGRGSSVSPLEKMNSVTRAPTPGFRTDTWRHGSSPSELGGRRVGWEVWSHVHSGHPSLLPFGRLSRSLPVSPLLHFLLFFQTTFSTVPSWCHWQSRCQDSL